MKGSTISDCILIELPALKSRAGNITPVSGNKEIPFSIKRLFYIYDIPGGESRGAHAHRECHQFLVAASGSFEIELFDGNLHRTIFLNRPNYGLHIVPGIWAHEKNFSSGAVCLVLTSHIYSATDYIRDIDQYLNEKAIALL